LNHQTRRRYDLHMAALTRRRSNDDREECWHVFYGDVQVGTIAIRTGIPVDQDRWGWTCGFYPGAEPGEHTAGTAGSFEQAREAFERAWQVFLAKRTEADFQAWRDHRDWMAQKHAIWGRGELLPSQKPNSMMRCPCGEMFDSHRLEHSLIHVPPITERHREIRHRSTLR
jgi:hypothetical protein